MKYISKILSDKVWRRIIPVYSYLNVMLFKFFLIHKTFFARVCFSMIYLTWESFTREKWRQEVAKTLRGFVFVLFLTLVFMCKSSQPRIYTGLLRFQSRAKDPAIHIMILTESKFQISFILFMLLYLSTYKKNQGIICNISEENNEHFLFTSI